MCRIGNELYVCDKDPDIKVFTVSDSTYIRSIGLSREAEAGVTPESSWAGGEGLCGGPDGLLYVTSSGDDRLIGIRYEI